MDVKSTVAGLLVLAVVATGVLWVRFRTATTGAVPAGQAAVRAAEDDALPNVTLADAAVDAGGVTIALGLSPNPPVAFAKMRVRVRAESGGSVLPLEGGRVTFEMSMPMGDHRYSLVPSADGWQEADVTLPLCPSGKRRWYATVEGSVAGRPRTARFRLDLAPPK